MHPTTCIEDEPDRGSQLCARALPRSPHLPEMTSLSFMALPCLCSSLAMTNGLYYIYQHQPPEMTAWNTVLTRIPQLRLSLVGKNSLDLASSVCQGHGRKEVNTHASYLPSRHQHSAFSVSAPALSLCPWPHIKVFLKKIFIQLTHFSIGSVVPFPPIPIKEAYLKAHIYILS